MVWFLLSIRNNDENCFLKVFSKLKTLLIKKGDSLFICFFCNLHLNFTSYYKIWLLFIDIRFNEHFISLFIWHSKRLSTASLLKDISDMALLYFDVL